MQQTQAEPAAAVAQERVAVREEVAVRHEPAQTQQVAARTESTQVAARPASTSITQIQQEMAEEGLEGLEMGYGAFPNIVLKAEGHFETNEGKVIGSHFDGLVQSSRPKIIIKNTKCDKREEDFVYTYDATWQTNPDALDTNGRSIHATIAGWKEKGWGFEPKKYLDVGIIVTGGELDGQFVIAQIPPTSIARFSGYSFTHGKRVKDIVTRFSVGQKVTNVDYPFYPWAFSKA